MTDSVRFIGCFRFRTRVSAQCISPQTSMFRGMTSFCRDRRSAADPPNADVCRGTQTIRELRAVMLDVTDVHQLMLQLRHAVPTETALRAVEIERVHRIIDDAIAERPVLENLRLRIWVALDTVIAASML